MREETVDAAAGSRSEAGPVRYEADGPNERGSDQDPTRSTYAREC